jgi:uncharacterized protein (TIGR02145 family)
MKITMVQLLFLSFIPNLFSQNFISIKIGNQVWSQKNSEIVEFRNGDRIKEILNKEDWLKAGYREVPAWCYYKFDSKYAYLGKIYNYYAISDIRNIAPNGWKIPTFNDYFNLVQAIDTLCSKKNFEKNGSMAGGSIKMKDKVNNSQTDCPQINSNFNAILAGGFSPSVNYPEYDWITIGEKAMFWCITDWNSILDFLDESTLDQAKKNIQSGKLDDKAIVFRLRNYDCIIDADDDPKINGYYLRFLKE